MWSGDLATAGAPATSFKDDFEPFETGAPQHSPTTNARAAAFLAASLGPPPSGDASSRNTPSPDPLLPKALVETHLVRATWECLEADFERCGYLLGESRASSQSVCNPRPTGAVGRRRSSACSHRRHRTGSVPMPSTPVEAVVKWSRSEDRHRTGKQGRLLLRRATIGRPPDSWTGGLIRIYI